MSKLLKLANLNLDIVDVKPIEIRKRQRPFNFKHKTKENYGLTFVTEGTIMYRFKNKTCKVEKGNILITRKGESFSAFSDPNNPETPYSFYILSFNILNKTFPITDRIVHVHLEKFLNLFYELEKCTQSRKPGYKINEKRIVYEIMYFLYKDWYSEKIVVPFHKNIEKAKLYIDNNFKDKITLEDIAEFSGFSKSHLRRLFKKYYEMSPSDYLLMVRLNKAKSMLRANAFYLNEIATECGFSNEYYFSKIFKKHVGCPPKKY